MSEASTYDRVVALLEEGEFALERYDERKVVMFRLVHEGITWPCMVLADDDAGSLVVYNHAPVSCEGEHRAELYDFLHRANLGFSRGAFEIEAASGDVRFRMGIDLRFHKPGRDELLDLIQQSIALFRHGLRGVLRVMNGKATAAEAIAMLEGEASEASAGER